MTTGEHLLKTYEDVSGQAINYSKSCVAFNGNLTEYDGQLLVDCLGMPWVIFHDRYLGLPVLVGKSKKDTFAHIKDRLWKKLNGWKGSLLSSAGKEILMKTVAQVVPLYTMQTFLLPTFCDELNQKVAQFWWEKEQGKRRIHWIRWKNLCKPKGEGGLGFKDIYAFSFVGKARVAVDT